MTADEELIRAALAVAATAGPRDVPIGAVVVGADGTELSRAVNAREALGDPTAHAEILALRAAAAVLGDGWRLEGRRWQSPWNRAPCARVRWCWRGSLAWCSAPGNPRRERSGRYGMWSATAGSTIGRRCGAECSPRTAPHRWRGFSPASDWGDRPPVR
ncbi:cytidine and deoxycytidylate deaminase zinc-binding region family protein [Mycobacterium kansasii]|uniref:Cytidine and deoxycytidylate deaminase zinc-binding region family protein n=1 Tax=Mycobacterium kansasii TaxID=1768 RepID=A0A1V3XB52_MYCKA|nr:cytidine and deoxycytidylate deaminase zinc-binding region family protein [Mycobacterium kansasii]